jgi:peptidoglycan hydrolase-like protein with peptidoglycan-binding domain
MALTSARFVNNLRLQAAAMDSPPMRPREIGDAVGLVQPALGDLGYQLPISYRSGSPDGIYGTETTAAVKQFQIDQYFPLTRQDGIAGRDTLTRLDSLFSPPPPPSPPRTKGTCWRQYIPVRPA